MENKNKIDGATGELKGCQNCIHYDNNGYSCKAFNSIPLEIISGEFNHTEKHPGQDNDIVFKRKNED